MYCTRQTRGTRRASCNGELDPGECMSCSGGRGDLYTTTHVRLVLRHGEPWSAACHSANRREPPTQLGSLILGPPGGREPTLKNQDGWTIGCRLFGGTELGSSRPAAGARTCIIQRPCLNRLVSHCAKRAGRFCILTHPAESAARALFGLSLWHWVQRGRPSCKRHGYRSLASAETRYRGKVTAIS